jgi:hypothetical protein
MTTLRFDTREGDTVPVPGSGIPGQIPRYVGQEFDHDSGTYKPKPFECESDSPTGQRLMKLIRRDASIIAHDAATAAACGVPFDSPTTKASA